MHRSSVLAFLAPMIATGALVLPTPAAHAEVVDVWSTNANMSACKHNVLNNYCFGLEDGQAIGLIDANLTVDELDQSLGIPYLDENLLPTPEGPDNPVVEIWNNTTIWAYAVPGASLADAIANGDTIYAIPAGADLTGPAVDLSIDDDLDDVTCVVGIGRNCNNRGPRIY